MNSSQAVRQTFTKLQIAAGILTALSVYVAVGYVQLAMRVYPKWRAGAAEGYPHEHEGLLIDAVGGVLLAVSLPLLPFLAPARTWPRGRRFALWITWGALMVGAFALQWYERDW